MRPVSIGLPPADDAAKIRWLTRGLQEIERVSHGISVEKVADAFTVTNLTETRTLDCDTATLAQLCDVVGTFIHDLKNRGSKNA